MLEACRTCLRLINVDNSPFYEIEADNMQLSADSPRYKLLSVVPEMALNLTPKSVLCAECHRSLEALFEFKKKCLKTENIIAQYFQTRLDLDVTNFDLKDVSAFNTSDIKPSEDELLKMLSEEVTVKEEVELCDTAIVKHEVDDFSLDRGEVLWPKNEVQSSNIPCEYSDVSCKQSSFVKLDLHTLTDERLHRCEICNHQFTKKHHLTVHVRTHTGERPYVCAVCGKDFPSKFQSTVHMRTHTGEKPYSCKMCDRSFAHKSNLTTHLQTHTGERQYACTVCGNNYSSRSYLKKHSCTLKKEQPDQCEKDCTVVIHRKKQKKSQCEHCKKLFWHKQHLQRHIMKEHKDVDLVIKQENFIEQKPSQNSISLPLEQ